MTKKAKLRNCKMNFSTLIGRGQAGILDVRSKMEDDSILDTAYVCVYREVVQLEHSIDRKNSTFPLF